MSMDGPRKILIAHQSIAQSLFVRLALASAILGIFCQSTGCSFYRDAKSRQRLDQGMTFVLPGIEGESLANGNIARGLESGEVSTAIRIYDWTTGFAPLALLHLRDSSRHRQQAKELAEEIVHYQTLYPERPVFLVGHSGGAAVSLFTLEALPDNHRVAGVFLLAPAISPGYAIEQVLAKTEFGIWNFYSPLDAPLLIAGTSLAGTVDGRWEASAGAFGFDYEHAPDAPGPRLQQVPYRPDMLLDQNPGGHIGPTFPGFVRKHIAPELVRITKQKDVQRTAPGDRPFSLNLRDHSFDRRAATVGEEEMPLPLPDRSPTDQRLAIPMEHH